MRYEQYRREYVAGGLRRDMLNECPFQQFEQWLQQAVDAGLDDPTAMALGTAELYERVSKFPTPGLNIYLGVLIRIIPY